MIQKPTISLHAPGVDVVLSNRAGRFVLMQGATGLGVAPRDLTVADLPGGGGVLRHVRSAVPRVTIPILLGGDYGERAADRRTLERLSEGDVEIRVTQPDGESRSRTGVYVDGLDGDYGAGEDSPDGQKLVLTFDCPDYRWFGPQREEAWSLSPKRTAWLSQMQDEPSAPRLVRSNFMLNPALDSDVGWVPSQNPDWVDASVSSEKTLFGTSVRRLETLVARTSMFGPGAVDQQAVFDTAASEYRRHRAAVWVWVPPAVRRVTVLVQSDASGEWVTTGTTTLADPVVGDPVIPKSQWSQVTVEEISPASGARRVRVVLDPGGSSTGGARLPVGTVSYVGAAVMTDAQSPVDYWDGDSTIEGHTASWDGDPYASVSRLHTIPVPDDDVQAVPFFPIMLSASTIQGARTLNIQGDADAYPIWTVYGPGEDFEIINRTTGERFFLEGEITSPVTIDSRTEQLSAEGLSNMELWARVPRELSTFPLRPGRNDISFVIVNATEQSKVELRYAEQWRAGY